jgi:hypothetical protein
MISATDIAAWWGAIVATFASVWGVFTWLKQGPRLRVSVSPRVTYPDSEVLTTETTPEGGTSSQLANYSHIEIVNTGDQPTTILDIEAAASSREGRTSMTGIGFKFHHGVALPLKLGPGETCSARLDTRTVEMLRGKGKLRLLVRFAHRADPLKIKIPE